MPIGVQVFEAEVETDAIERLADAGIGWARTRALWKLIERTRETPAVYDWTVTDWLFGDTTAAGLRNVASVYANPPWAAASECGPVDPEHRDRYAALWSALVERYDGDGIDDAPNGAIVSHWQVSNEADFDPTVASSESDYGGCFGDDPAAYAEHLALAYRAAKAASPKAQVGFGPVAYDRFTASSAPVDWPAAPGPFVYDFTREAIRHLHEAYAGDPDLPFFDFVSVHNYNDNAHYWDTASEGATRREMVAKVEAFKDAQLVVPGDFDVRQSPIMVSETGLASSPSDAYTERNETLQAHYVAKTMVRGMAAGAVATIWYTARDNIFGDCTAPHWDWLAFGLMRSQEYRDALDATCPEHPWIDDYELDQGPATPRPAMQALATVVEQLEGMAFDRQLRDDETGDPAIEAYRFVPAAGAVAGTATKDADDAGDAEDAGDSEDGGGADDADDRDDADRQRPTPPNVAAGDVAPTVGRIGAGAALIVAWTTTGERIGKRGVEPVMAEMVLDASVLSPWTGRIRVTVHDGSSLEIGDEPQAAIPVDLYDVPLFITTAP